MTDLINKSASEKRKEKQRLAREKYLSDLRCVLAMPEGRRIFWSVLENAGIWQGTFVQGDNGYSTTYNEGRRSSGLNLLNDILEAKPSALEQMQREQKSFETLKEIESETEKEEHNILSTAA